MCYLIILDGVQQKKVYSTEAEAEKEAEWLISQIKVKTRDKWNKTKWTYPEVAIVKISEE